MPRFSDTWVLDKTMFIYLQGGTACICCAPQPLSLFAPEKDPVETMIRSLSDLNAGEVEREICALKTSPWDEEMRDQVWGDRGLLRYRMKKEMRGYKQFFENIAESTNADDNVIAVLHKFCKNHVQPSELHHLFQLTRDDLEEVLKTKYKICSFFTIVFSAVAEQLEKFELTGYGVDAPSCSDECNNSELCFEQDFKFDKNGRGFCIDIADVCKNTSGDTQFKINDAVLLRFLQRMASLSGPNLLSCASSSEPSRSAPCFRSDRRLMRLIVARLWADRIIEKYTEFTKCNN